MNKPKERTLGGWIAAKAVATLTIVGAVFYVALRLTHETLYGRLGLTPEDVGLGFGEAIARAPASLSTSSLELRPG